MNKFKKIFFSKNIATKSSSSSSSSSDEEESMMIQIIALDQITQNNEQAKRGGSSIGRQYYCRNRIAGDEQLRKDYFDEDCTYPAHIFRLRFRMNRPLFVKILTKVQQYDDYFIQKSNAAGVIGFFGLQKMTAAIRMLAYGMLADAVDEYIRIGKSTTLESLNRFCRAIVHIFEAEYLRSPNEDDVARLLEEGAKRGFPGMLGSLDCMHWNWENCPNAWHGSFTGHVHKPTIILEAVASYDLWIWHAFFGMPGGWNDINVLDQSTLFNDLVAGRAPPANFTINGHQYDMGYYLADDIYPKWATIVQTIPQPQGQKRQLFAKMQEACRKDVERAFGVLQARFAIVRRPTRLWYPEDLAYVMKTCIILHNMITEDGREDDVDTQHANLLSTTPIEVERNSATLREFFFTQHRRMRSFYEHNRLRNDLIEHIWERQGEL